MGPDLQYAAEKPADPIELRVYRGADGTFTLYEDENDGYNYEKGRLRDHTDRLERRDKHADHRRAERQVSRNAGESHIPNCVRR